MLLFEGLTRVHSQKKTKLHFGESFTLNSDNATESHALLSLSLFIIQLCSVFDVNVRSYTSSIYFSPLLPKTTSEKPEGNKYLKNPRKKGENRPGKSETN